MHIENEPLVHGEKKDPIVIDGKKRNTFSLPIVIKYNGLKQGISGVLTKNKIKYALYVKVTIATPIGNLDFDFSKEDDIRIPKIPRFTITKVTADEVGIACVRA